MRAATILLLLLPVFPGAYRSQSPFDGTWVIDTSKHDGLGKIDKPLHGRADQ